MVITVGSRAEGHLSSLFDTERVHCTSGQSWFNKEAAGKAHGVRKAYRSSGWHLYWIWCPNPRCRKTRRWRSTLWPLPDHLDGVAGSVPAEKDVDGAHYVRRSDSSQCAL